MIRLILAFILILLLQRIGWNWPWFSALFAVSVIRADSKASLVFLITGVSLFADMLFLRRWGISALICLSLMGVASLLEAWIDQLKALVIPLMAVANYVMLELFVGGELSVTRALLAAFLAVLFDMIRRLITRDSGVVLRTRFQ